MKYMSGRSAGRVSGYECLERGGAEVRWSRDGEELYYVNSESRLTAVPVHAASESLKFGDPIVPFNRRAPQRVVQAGGSHQQYDRSRDGKFLVNTQVSVPAFPPITVILNWHAGH